MARKQKKDEKQPGKKIATDEQSIKNLDLKRKSKFTDFLKNNGIDLDSVKPKMEKYKSLLDWNNDSIAYTAARVELVKKAAELYNTIGGKAAEFQTEIIRISYMIDMLEKKLLEEGKNPLESKEYQSALKLKKDLMVEFKKLNLDYGKAMTDYNYKKALKPDMEDGFTVINDETEDN